MFTFTLRGEGVTDVYRHFLTYSSVTSGHDPSVKASDSHYMHSCHTLMVPYAMKSVHKKEKARKDNLSPVLMTKQQSSEKGFLKP